MISTELVQTLRAQTGARIMDCQKALIASEGNLDKAKEWLRKNGIALATKKANRLASDGLVAVRTQEGTGVILEMNSETDFVARGSDFQNMILNIASVALENKMLSAPALEACKIHGETVRDVILGLAGKVGENIVLRRFASLSVYPGIVASYVHMPLAPSLGKIGVLVALRSHKKPEEIADIGHSIAMHIAACQPQYISIDQVPENVLEKEREILRAQVEQSGKPAAVVDKMVEGRLKKFFESIVLYEQDFVRDPSLKIKDLLTPDCQVVDMICFALGGAPD